MNLPPKSLAVFCRRSTMAKRVLLGIATYLQENENWILSPFEKAEILPIEQMERDFVGAMLVDPTSVNETYFDQLNERIPVIYVGSAMFKENRTTLSLNRNSIAKIAAQAFKDRGFKSLAYVGHMSSDYSKGLQHAFCEETGNLGISPFVFMAQGVSDPCLETGSSEKLLLMYQRLKQWLASLPAHTGIFAADDKLGFDVIKVGHELGLKIPEGIAVLGVNDDDLLCKITRPNLSSIRLPFEKMGYDATEIIVKMQRMAKKHPSIGSDGQPASLVYEPIGLISRESTKTVVVDDPIVRDALRFIHENFMFPINVESIFERLNVSRSLLERRFREELGVTPLVELRRQRIEKARALLSDTNETIHDMGKRCGFSSAIRFTTVFKEQVGMTPTEFRRRMLPNVL